MARYDFRTPRLYLESPMAAGSSIALDHGRTNYLINVLRLGAGDSVLAFNGRDGEWRAQIVAEGTKRTALVIREQARPQTTPADLHYLFAPLKHARLDYMMQKAVEMGASRLAPVLTRRTMPQRVNLARMRANAIEAAEQCGILTIPEIAAPVDLGAVIAAWQRARLLVFCDEDADGLAPLSALSAPRDRAPNSPIAVLIGPEGGFADEERAALLRLPSVVRLSLGPRILRADTAAVAALALVQAALGDWR